MVYGNNCSSDSKVQLRLNFQKEDISVIERYGTVAVYTRGRLLLVPVFGTIFQKYAKFWQFFRETLDLHLDLIYMIYDKLTPRTIIFLDLI